MKSTEKIWHDENSEPPKNYIWAKNGKFFKYIDGQWKEISKKDGDGGSGDGDSIDINTILDNISIKDDLLTKLESIDYSNQDPETGVLTDLTFDDIFNDYNDFIKSCLYRQELPAITEIGFPKYNKTIKLIIEDIGIMSLGVIPGGVYIRYEVFIFYQDNSIDICAKQTNNKPV